MFKNSTFYFVSVWLCVCACACLFPCVWDVLMAQCMDKDQSDKLGSDFFPPYLLLLIFCSPSKKV